MLLTDFITFVYIILSKALRAKSIGCHLQNNNCSGVIYGKKKKINQIVLISHNPQ